MITEHRLTIAHAVLSDVIEHAMRESPRECCGLLVGSGDCILDAVRARNLSESPSRYLIDPVDHIRARRDARAQALDVVGFYHSHPASRAYPSASDIAEVCDEQALWMIVGVWEGTSEVRVFAITHGEVQEFAYDVDG